MAGLNLTLVLASSAAIGPGEAALLESVRDIGSVSEAARARGVNAADMKTPCTIRSAWSRSSRRISTPQPTATGRSAAGRTRIKEGHALLCHGYTEVVDADLSKYFDRIPHQDLMRSVARRIVDRQVLELIKLDGFNNLASSGSI